MTTAALLLATLALAAPEPPAALDAQALGRRCGRGFAVDCRTLGRAYLGGDGTARDDRLAAAHAMQACELGDPAACSDLGVLHAIGRGVPQSDEKALALSQRACEQGPAVACSNQGALLAEGAGTLPRPANGEDPSAPILRLFRKACEAGVPEGCTNLGTALDSGKLTYRDARGAVRAYRSACDAGFALACLRLSLVLKERPDLAPDLTSVALEVRACRAGIAPTCYAVSEKTPALSGRTPAARLVDDPRSYILGIPGTGGFSPGELTARAGASRPKRALADLVRPPEAIQAAVPPAVRAALGVDAPAAPVVAADPAVDLLVALRRPQLGQCYEATRAAAAPRTEAYAVFVLDGDGRPAPVRAASVPADRDLDACVKELVETWEFPASPDGYSGPYLVRFTYDAAPVPPPEFAGPGYLRPALRDASCVDRSVRVPAELRGSAAAVTVKVAISGEGKPALVHALTPVADDLLAAVSSAVSGCAWTPGGDADGRPIPIWSTLTVKLERR